MRYRYALAAFVLLFSSLYSKGQSAYVDSLQQIVAQNKHDDAEMKSYILLATECFRKAPNKAKGYLYSAIKWADEAGNLDRQCGANTLLLSIYQEEGNRDSATYCVNKLKAISAKAPDDIKVQTNFNSALGLYYKKNGDVKSALPYTLAAIKYIEKNPNASKANIAGQWLNAGNVYEGLGDYNSAMRVTLKALGLFEEAGNKLGEAFCYNNISGYYNKLNQYSNALKYAQKSLELKTALGDKRGVLTSMLNIASAYRGLNNLAGALEKYEAIIKLAAQEKTPTEECTANYDIAQILVQQKKPDEARRYFERSKEIAIQIDNKLLVANADMSLSALSKSADSLHQREKMLSNSLQVFQKVGDHDREGDIYKRMADFYASNNDFEKALEYTNKHHAIKDSVTGASVLLQLKALEEQYNSAKKEKEIELLKKDQELQKENIFNQRLMTGAAAGLFLFTLLGIGFWINRNKLRQRMKELELRNQIAADLHDEVGSSLSSIHMLSQMVAQPGNDTVNKDLLRRMSTNAKETMDKMGDIVWMIKPVDEESASLKQRMERFAYEISSNKNIETNIELNDLDKVKLSVSQRKNIYLIFKEGLNNSIKYSGTNKIDIKASSNNHELQLQVKDYGKGFEILSGKGNGLDNMKNRAREMNGKLEILSSAEGTNVELSIPI